MRFLQHTWQTINNPDNGLLKFKKTSNISGTYKNSLKFSKKKSILVSSMQVNNAFKLNNLFTISSLIIKLKELDNKQAITYNTIFILEI